MDQQKNTGLVVKNPSQSDSSVLYDETFHAPINGDILWVRISLQAPPHGINAENQSKVIETPKVILQMVESAIAKDLFGIFSQQSSARETQQAGQ